MHSVSPIVAGFTRKSVVLVAVLGLLGVACGANGIGTGSDPSPTPSQGSGLGFDYTATEQDHALTMHVGQKLEVVLHGGSTTNWQQVKSSNPAVLAPIVDPAATAVRGVTLAAFQARADGNSEISAVGSPNCQSGQPCPMYAVLYSLRVTVTQ